MNSYILVAIVMNIVVIEAAPTDNPVRIDLPVYEETILPQTLQDNNVSEDRIDLNTNIASNEIDTISIAKVSE